MEYNVIKGEILEDLINSVNELLSDGWIPQGGISTVVTGVGVEFYQALVKII